MMELIRWPTPVSDCKSLRFKQLVDDGEGRFVIESESGDVYEFILDGYCGPYVISNEEYLTKYWSGMDKNIGWTFEVHGSDFIKNFPGVMESRSYTHYVVSTVDTCLEVLSEKEPVIRKVR